VYFVRINLGVAFYRDKKLSGVFVRFRAPLAVRQGNFSVTGNVTDTLREVESANYGIRQFWL
jgi:hypothetical protein